MITRCRMSLEELARRLLGALLIGCMLIGCANPQRAEVDEDDGLHPVWPTQGEPRIVHRQNIRGSTQIGQPGFLERIAEAITGPQQQRLLRPQSIALGDGQIFIVDQELQGVHVFQDGSNKASFIARVDRTTYFVSPVGIAWCDGAIAVSDSSLKQVFLLTPSGKLQRRLEKPGGFQRPTGLAYDRQRKLLYVVDTLANEVCVFGIDGRFVRAIGSHGSMAGEFHYPTYAAVDDAGRLYVTDSLNFRIQILDRDGAFVSQIGTLGNASGYMAVPKGIGVDRAGHIYIVDSYFSAVQIFSQQGEFLLSFGEVGKASGQFQVPTGLLVAGDNRIYVCDAHNSRVQVFEYVGGDP